MFWRLQDPGTIWFSARAPFLQGRSLNLTFTRQQAIQLSVRGRNELVTELLRPSVSSVAIGAAHEFGMAGAVKCPGANKCPGVVKSPGLVVGCADAGQRRKHRNLVLAVPLPAGIADRRTRQQVRRRAYALSLGSICLRLR